MRRLGLRDQFPGLKSRTTQQGLYVQHLSHDGDVRFRGGGSNTAKIT